MELVPYKKLYQFVLSLPVNTLQFWKLGVQGQGKNMVGFWWDLSSFLADGRLLIMSSYDLLVCVCTSFYYKDTSHVGLGSDAYDLI